MSGNPIIPGWYADPEAHVFAGRYWIHPTYSAPYDQQTYMDAFSSTDLVTWTKHPRIIDAPGSSDQVYIDRGRRDRIVRGLTFEV